MHKRDGIGAGKRLGAAHGRELLGDGKNRAVRLYGMNPGDLKGCKLKRMPGDPAAILVGKRGRALLGRLERLEEEFMRGPGVEALGQDGASQSSISTSAGRYLIMRYASNKDALECALRIASRIEAISRNETESNPRKE
jgi:hypothetical protein